MADLRRFLIHARPATTIPPTGALKAGRYTVEVVHTTRIASGPVAVIFEVRDGERRGARFLERFDLEAADDFARDCARADFEQLCRAARQEQVLDVKALRGVTIEADLAAYPVGQPPTSNEIVAYWAPGTAEAWIDYQGHCPEEVLEEWYAVLDEITPAHEAEGISRGDVYWDDE